MAGDKASPYAASKISNSHIDERLVMNRRLVLLYQGAAIRISAVLIDIGAQLAEDIEQAA